MNDQTPLVSACALRSVPWIATTSGRLTVRDALVGARTIEGLDLKLSGVEVGAQMRFLAAVAALVVRHQETPIGAFDPTAVDAAMVQLAEHTDLYGASHPFLQVHAAEGRPAVGSKTPVKKLYPWMPADRAEDFWSSNTQPASLDEASATLALAVHYYYSFGGNNKLDGRSCVNGSPAIRYPGVGYTATEVLRQGANLFETLLINTPLNWVEGEGLPAWADPECRVSRSSTGGSEHPLWRATWGSNIASCLWVDRRLVAVSTGGSPYRPPTMGSSKEAAKAWWDLRNTEDSFYLYIDIEKKTAAGVVTSVERKAQRLDLGHNETDLAVEWNAKNLSAAMLARSQGTVAKPKRSAQVMFLRHLVEGSASSPVVRRSEVLVSSAKKWAVAPERAIAVSSAAALMKTVCSELSKPFTMNGRLTALRDRREDLETAFWHNVARPFDDFIINGEGDSVDPAVWPDVRKAALEAFDEVTSTSSFAKLAPLILTARSRVAWNTADVLGLNKPAAVGRQPADEVIVA